MRGSPEASRCCMVRTEAWRQVLAMPRATQIRTNIWQSQEEAPCALRDSLTDCLCIETPQTCYPGLAANPTLVMRPFDSQAQYGNSCLICSRKAGTCEDVSQLYWQPGPYPAQGYADGCCPWQAMQHEAGQNAASWGPLTLRGEALCLDCSGSSSASLTTRSWRRGPATEKSLNWRKLLSKSRPVPRVM